MSFKERVYTTALHYVSRLSKTPEAKVVSIITKVAISKQDIAVINFKKLDINDEDRDRIIRALSEKFNVFKHPEFNYIVVSIN